MRLPNEVRAAKCSERWMGLRSPVSCANPTTSEDDTVFSSVSVMPTERSSKKSVRMNLPPLRTLFFEDLSVGMTETLEKTVSSSDVVGFAQLTGDRNPIHLSEHFAARTSFGKRIAHGLYTASLISAVLGTRLPGPGAMYISQTLNFRAPVKIGDT